MQIVKDLLSHPSTTYSHSCFSPSSSLAATSRRIASAGCTKPCDSPAPWASTAKTVLLALLYLAVREARLARVAPAMPPGHVSAYPKSKRSGGVFSGYSIVWIDTWPSHSTRHCTFSTTIALYTVQCRTTSGKPSTQRLLQFFKRAEGLLDRPQRYRERVSSITSYL